jgi:hypothetical protein
MATNRFEVPENETFAREFFGLLALSGHRRRSRRSGLGTGSKWDVY